jgi:hypothetical protein
MRSFIALQRRTAHPGGWLDCVAWARERAQEGPPVRILTARAEEHTARVVAEVTADGERLITGGRTVPLRQIRHA